MNLNESLHTYCLPFTYKMAFFDKQMSWKLLENHTCGSV